MLWAKWMAVVLQLRPAFKRIRTFQWSVTILAAIAVRKDFLGVTSYIRSIGILPSAYTCVLNLFHSDAVNLKLLTELWFKLILKIFPFKFRINGKPVLIGDGIKIGKEGRKMPAVKLLHQSSQSNSKAKYIMGHSFQAISILTSFCKTFMAVPISCRIHEGIRKGPKDRKTLMDKFFSMTREVKIKENVGDCYLVADAYYACGKLAKGLNKDGISLITRVRKDGVAYLPVKKYSGKGRPRKYGKKVKLWNFFTKLEKEMVSPIYEDDTFIRYGVFDLLWRPYGEKVRFCLVDYPGRGRVILMSVDVSVGGEDIIRAYGLRFKIECGFKELVHDIGAFRYHFWLLGAKKKRRGDGEQHIHKEPLEQKIKIHQKINAYHLHVQMGVIAQGMNQYIASNFGAEVWSSTGVWLRTRRARTPAGTMVVKDSLTNNMGYFFETLPKGPQWQKFTKSIFSKGPPDSKKAA